MGHEGRGDAVTPMMELLEILDGADPAMPTSVTALAMAAAPPPLNAGGHIDFRTRAAREWYPRWEDLANASIDLIDAGLAEVVDEAPGLPYKLAITDAGRGYLAEMRALP